MPKQSYISHQLAFKMLHKHRFWNAIFLTARDFLTAVDCNRKCFYLPTVQDVKNVLIFKIDNATNCQERNLIHFFLIPTEVTEHILP